MRLNKYLSDIGYCSRREGDRLIAEGRVCVDGAAASVGMQIEEGQTVSVDGKYVAPNSLNSSLNDPMGKVVIAYNKPVGVECTSAKDNPDNIIDRINYPVRIYPIGRLDKASTGLILLTNNGELVNSILKSENSHEKEYVVTVDKPVTRQFIQKMSDGVLLKDVPLRNKKGSDGRMERKTVDIMTKKCKAVRLDDNKFSIVLTQGVNRQIRRMCRALGYEVTSLHRVRVMNIVLDNLKTGEYREISGEELTELLSKL